MCVCGHFSSKASASKEKKEKSQEPESSRTEGKLDKTKEDKISKKEEKASKSKEDKIDSSHKIKIKREDKGEIVTPLKLKVGHKLLKNNEFNIFLNIFFYTSFKHYKNSCRK